MREPIVASEAADGLALGGHNGQRRVLANRIAKFLEFSVNGVLAQDWCEGLGIEENINVFRKPLNQIPTLGQAGAPFEDDLVAHGTRDGTQGLGNKLLLFDHCRTQATTAKMILGAEHGLAEILMFKESHLSGAPSHAMTARWANRPAGRIQTVKADSVTPGDDQSDGRCTPFVRPKHQVWHEPAAVRWRQL